MISATTPDFRRSFLFWTLILGLLSALSIWSRTFLPVDETRYVSVAWEMWLRGDFLVPFKNGEPYCHKPPLLFWLVHAGWWLFGVNDIWPRLIAPLLTLLDLALTWRIARRLWPEQAAIAPMAATILLASAVWMAYGQMYMFDILVASCALLGLWGLVEVGLGGTRRWWLLFALAVGLGGGAKGPAILVHLLPAALLAPWWMPVRPASYKGWYGALLGSILLGVALALCWAIPAGLAGGEAYRNAIFWGQTANRMVESFAHKRPIWWYLAASPALFAPWLLWPSLWRRSWQTLRAQRADPGVRFALVWFLAAFAVFSFISGKQVHYLLPEYPALALLLGFVLARCEPLGRPLTPALVMVLMGLAGPFLTAHFQGVELLWRVQAGAGVVALGMLLYWLGRSGDNAQQVMRLALATVAGFGWLLFTLMRPIGTHFDGRPVAEQIAHYQSLGYRVGYQGKYHAQFQFLGRLTQPLEEVNEGWIEEWLAFTPKAVLLMDLELDEDPFVYDPLFVQRYRSEWLLLVDENSLDALEARELKSRQP